MTSVADAVKRAKQHAGLRPLVLADVSDNPGGGAPSDSTYILQALLDQGLRDVAIGMLFDPELVRMCHEAGVGAVLDARVGGKVSRFSGQPVDLEVTVRAVARNATMDVLGLAHFPLGDTAWIEGRGVSIALSSVRTQMYAPSGFTHLGIEPTQYRTIVVKSSNHFRAAFADVANEVELVSTPGALDFDFARLPYRAFRRPYYPKVANPHAT
jgi:microcystin degradation protein MlrC